MNPAPELAPQLKSLRLSGILDSLAARNRQAIESKLAYTEFLALLLSDEVAAPEEVQHPAAPGAVPKPPRRSSSLILPACLTSTAPWCMTWPRGAIYRRKHPC